jgi:sulfofructose kinase
VSIIACVGIAVMDLMFRVDPLPAGGGKSYATAFREIGGGVAANAAVAIARLGGRARYIGRVGDDPIGERIVSELQADGVDTNGVRAVSGVVSPVSAVLVDDAGERTIVNYTSSRLFDGGDHHQAGELAGVDAVLVDVRWPDGAVLALTSASEAGIPGVFDFDRPMDAHGDVLLAAASHVAFSHSALTATARSDEPEVGLARVAEHTDAWLAVTMGDAGVVWREAGSTHHLPAFPVEVVDTVGAGDVFHGALALALAEGQPEAEAVRFASAAAALKCTRPGGRAGSPSRRDVEGLLAHAT